MCSDSFLEPFGPVLHSLLSSCVDPQDGASQPLREGAYASAASLRISVLSHLSQLGCQVDSYVFIQGVVCDISRVVQVVETVQSLPLL